jgi:hypothetical protein
VGVRRVAVVVLTLRVALAVMFGVAALAKIAVFRRTRARVRLFGIPEAISRTVAIAIPATELAAVALLIPDATARGGGVVAALALGVFSVAVARLLVRHEAPDCNCFGVLHTTRVGPGMLVRNLVLTALALIVVIAGPGVRTGIAFWPWAALVVAAAAATVLGARLRDRRERQRRVRPAEGSAGGPPPASA